MRLMRSVGFGLLILGLTACAPRQQFVAEAFVSPQDRSTTQTLIAPFYPQLTRLGITVEDARAYAYSGQDARAERFIVNDLYAQNEGFCPLREGVYRLSGRPYVLMLAADGDTQVRGLVYDLTRRPMLSYSYFSGHSLRALPTRRCT